MIKIFLTLALFFGLLEASSLQSAKNYDEAIKIAKSQNKNVLAFFHTEYCGWCNKMKKTTLKDVKVIDFINKNYIFVSIDRDKDTYPEQFNPRFIPTTYIIDPKKNQEIDAIMGYKNSADFIYALSDEG